MKTTVVVVGFGRGIIHGDNPGGHVSEVTEVYALRHISRRPSLSFFFLTHES
jgi:hypothetical protein